LNREQVDILERDLQGLKARYELHDGSKRQYKCNFLVEEAKEAEDTRSQPACREVLPGDSQGQTEPTKIAMPVA
jgi:hypothetical protein